MDTTPRLAVGYIRVSTTAQADEGVSLDAQRARIAAWCAVHDRTLFGDIHEDAGLSGGRADNRPALQAALDAACASGGVLVVYSLSRLARSTRDALVIGERLAAAGADLVSLSEQIDTTSATGKMIFRFLAVLAEFERDQIVERTRAGLAYKRARGERTGGIPYGTTLAADGKTLVASPAEQRGLARMRELRRLGLSYRTIADYLDAEGFSPKSGGRWSHQAIYKILSSYPHGARPCAASSGP